MRSISLFNLLRVLPLLALWTFGRIRIEAFTVSNCKNTSKRMQFSRDQKSDIFRTKALFRNQRVKAINMVETGQDRRDFLSHTLATSALLVSTSLLPKVMTSQPVNAMLDAPNLLDIPVQYEGKDVFVKDILGPKATLIVNVASSCALTDGSYKGLVSLYKEYKDKGLEIVAFPCNQFGFQEPDEESFIRKDIKRRYGVDFKLYDKIDVNGPSAHPLYKRIKMYEPELSGYGDKIAWNFEKFLVDENGKVVRRYRPGVKPESIIPDVKTLIEKGKLGPPRKRSLNEYD